MQLQLLQKNENDKFGSLDPIGLEIFFLNMFMLHTIKKLLKT